MIDVQAEYDLIQMEMGIVDEVWARYLVIHEDGERDIFLVPMGCNPEDQFLRMLIGYYCSMHEIHEVLFMTEARKAQRESDNPIDIMSFLHFAIGEDGIQLTLYDAEVKENASGRYMEDLHDQTDEVSEGVCQQLFQNSLIPTNFEDQTPIPEADERVAALLGLWPKYEALLLA